MQCERTPVGMNPAELHGRSGDFGIRFAGLQIAIAAFGGSVAGLHGGIQNFGIGFAGLHL